MKHFKLTGNFTMVPNELCHSTIPATEKAVYLCIAAFNPAFPSIRAMHRIIGLSPTTINRATRKLENRGLLRCSRGGRSRSNAYAIRSTADWLVPRNKYDVPNASTTDSKMEHAVPISDTPLSQPVARNNTNSKRLINNSFGIIHEFENSIKLSDRFKDFSVPLQYSWIDEFADINWIVHTLEKILDNISPNLKGSALEETLSKELRREHARSWTSKVNKKNTILDKGSTSGI